jgi:micrococcal nuclease
MHPGNLIENYVRRVVVRNVVDGDTVDVEIDLGWDLYYRERIRLAGINAPEVRTKDQEEKLDGVRSKEALTQVLAQSDIIMLHSHKFERGKYDRTIGVLYADGMNVNEFMVANEFAEAKDYG